MSAINNFTINVTDVTSLTYISKICWPEIIDYIPSKSERHKNSPTDSKIQRVISTPKLELKF